jgi:four helix bundle protein
VNKQSQKLEDYALWKLVSHIAEQCYGILENFPEDERYGMQSKLRKRAFDVTSDVAEAIGSIDPRDTVWYFGMARRSIFGIKNTLSMAAKAGYISAMPELMVDIQTATTNIDIEIEKSILAIPIWYKDMDARQKDAVK